MTNHVVHGFDLSKYQGPWDFVTATEAGLEFVYIRAGGAYKDTKRPFTDYRFKENARKAADVGMPAGFYWYFVPHSNATQQADYFSNLIALERRDLGAVIDLEFSAGLNPAAVTSWAAQFVARVYDNLGIWCDCYSRSYWLHDNTIDHSIWEMMKLWIARYKPGIAEPWNPNEAAKLKPPYWDVENVWQYTEEGDATKYGGLGHPTADDDVDLNWFHGTREEFEAWSGVEPPLPTATVLEINEPKNAVLRTEPKGLIAQAAYNGIRYGVAGTERAADGSLWYDVGGLWVLADHVKILEGTDD